MAREKAMGANLDNDVRTLRVLRHSVRVTLGLAHVHSDEWCELESRLYEVESAARDRSTASRAPLRAAIRSVERFGAQLQPRWLHAR
jgi:hypothetical protein